MDPPYRHVERHSKSRTYEGQKRKKTQRQTRVLGTRPLLPRFLVGRLDILHLPLCAILFLRPFLIDQNRSVVFSQKTKPKRNRLLTPVGRAVSSSSRFFRVQTTSFLFTILSVSPHPGLVDKQTVSPPVFKDCTTASYTGLSLLSTLLLAFLSLSF